MSSRSSQPSLIFEPRGIRVEIESGRSLLDLAADGGLPLRSDCGGKGRCGKCQVEVSPAEAFTPLTEAEKGLLSAEQIAAGRRLACQAQALTPATVNVPGEGLEGGDVEAKTGLKGAYPVQPTIRRVILPQADKSQPQDDYDDLTGWLKARAGAAGLELPLGDPEPLRSLSQPKALSREVTLVLHRDRGLTAALPGRRERSLGFALDLGTTTLAGYLCDLASGQILATAGEANPQRRYGEDVISRIAFANQEAAGLRTLNRLVIEAINDLIGRCLDRVGAERADVDEVSLVGNTTMEQIAVGFHPYSLGQAPYLPVRRRPGDFRAADLGLDLDPATNVHVFPVISGFVGGDTVGAILAVRPQESQEICLIVDIGTNGELVLGSREGLWATSCATGPALEGAHISCGMRAATGAIHRLDVDPASLEVSYEVLGDPESARPAGLCGSGIIDAVAALRRAGLILESGRLREGRPGVIIDEEGVGRRFVLVPAGRAGGQEVALALADIRQVQLAKAALAVGISFLMRAAGVSRVDRLVLTGAFGARFDWRNAVTIGMLPQAAAGGRVEILENGAGLGAVLALLDRTRREEALTLVSQVRCLDLAAEPDFQIEYPLATAFPPLAGTEED